VLYIIEKIPSQTNLDKTLKKGYIATVIMRANTNNKKIKKILFVFGIFMCLTFCSTFSASALTVEDEKKLGKEFYEKLERKGVFLNDRKINDYFNTIGQSILSQGKTSPFSFTFTVIKNPGINAFATPGGYVYVYSGLIKISENEAQVAGVLAHEIAHVKCRHIAKILEKSKKVGIATMAAILAGAFIGGGDETTAAVTTFSIAAAASMNLKYTREHEEEADRMGMSYLVKAGYDGKGMLDFLKIMRQYEYYSNSIPSYFLTHPGTGERIAYLDGLLQTTYKKRGKEDITEKYERIKTSLILGETNPESKLKYFENRLKDKPDDIEGLYGCAVVYGDMGRTEDSFRNFKKALLLAPDDADILRDMGIQYFNLGSTGDAIDALQRAYFIEEDDEDTIFFLGRAYDAAGNYRSALELYEKFRKGNPDNTDIYYNLAMIEGKINNQGESHYNFGIYFKKRGKPKSALFHFKEALKYIAPESTRGSEIQKEIDSMK
jgi:predicted Zn-dependent protease